jgi:hypothetical protein
VFSVIVRGGEGEVFDAICSVIAYKNLVTGAMKEEAMVFTFPMDEFTYAPPRNASRGMAT